jgi:hypothetical protein
MCPSEVTCLPADCCFCELALWKSNSTCWSRTKRTSSSSHWKLTCSRHNIDELLLSNNHSLNACVNRESTLFCTKVSHWVFVVTVQFSAQSFTSCLSRDSTIFLITLTITPPIPLHMCWNRGAEYCTDTTPTHDVKSLCRMLYCPDSHTMQIRCALNYTVTRHAQCETILYKIALSRLTHDLKLCGEYYTVRTCIRCEFAWKNIVLSRHTQNVKTLCRTLYCHDLHTM